MVSEDIIRKQLKALNFNIRGWGRTEVRELGNILLPEEEIYECVNGIYEGGFALMLATDIRVLLVDKKPLNYLTVEDMRYELISEIDYNHRLIGAYISLSSGSKNLRFSSLNQPRLRKLIGHVQFCMAESKKKQTYHQEGQNQHLKQLNNQLKSYLLAQRKQQQRLHEQLQEARTNPEAAGKLLKEAPELVKPGPELEEYLQDGAVTVGANNAVVAVAPAPAQQVLQPEPTTPVTALKPAPPVVVSTRDQLAELYAEGMQEVFGRQPKDNKAAQIGTHALANSGNERDEVNSLKIAYSKLPMAMRNRKFGRPLFHAHSQSRPVVTEVAAAEVEGVS